MSIDPLGDSNTFKPWLWLIPNSSNIINYRVVCDVENCCFPTILLSQMSKLENTTALLSKLLPRFLSSGLDQNWLLSPVPQDAHNDFRREHGSAALQWSDECYQSAKKQADACQAKGCMFHVPWYQLARDFAQDACWRVYVNSYWYIYTYYIII
jgi:hypothetical protein